MSHISLPRSLATSLRLTYFSSSKKAACFHFPFLLPHTSGITWHWFRVQHGRVCKLSRVRQLQFCQHLLLRVMEFGISMVRSLGPFVTRCLSGFLVYCVHRERKEEGPFLGGCQPPSPLLETATKRRRGRWFFGPQEIAGDSPQRGAPSVSILPIY